MTSQKKSGHGILQGTCSVTTPLVLGTVSPLDSFHLANALTGQYGDPLKNQATRVQMLGTGALAALFGIVYALRNSEVLSLDMSCVLSDGSIAVRGKKGSEAQRIVIPRECWITGAISHFDKSIRLFPTNYGRCYRAAVSLGLADMFEGHVHQTVTHLGRHQLAGRLMETGQGDLVQDCLRHKSEMSQAWYKGEADLRRDRLRKRLQRERQRTREESATKERNQQIGE